jgi:hypothetical protein
VRVRENPTARVLEILVRPWIWAEDFATRSHDFLPFTFYPLSYIFYLLSFTPDGPDRNGEFPHLVLDVGDGGGSPSRVKVRFHRVPSKFANVGLAEPGLPAVIPGRLLGLWENMIIEGWLGDVHTPNWR